MPFDKTSESSTVIELLKVRDYINQHGFSPDYGTDGCARCFMGAISSVIKGETKTESFLEQQLAKFVGEKYRGFEFASTFLATHNIDTTKALKIIDDAIASELI